MQNQKKINTGAKDLNSGVKDDNEIIKKQRKLFIDELNNSIVNLNKIKKLKKEHTLLKKKFEDLLQVIDVPEEKRVQDRRNISKLARNIKKLMSNLDSETKDFLNIDGNKSKTLIEGKLENFLLSLLKNDDDKENQYDFQSLFNEEEQKIIKSHFFHNNDEYKKIDSNKFFNMPNSKQVGKKENEKNESSDEEEDKEAKKRELTAGEKKRKEKEATDFMLLSNINTKMNRIVNNIKSVLDECKDLLDDIDMLVKTIDEKEQNVKNISAKKKMVYIEPSNLTVEEQNSKEESNRKQKRKIKL